MQKEKEYHQEQEKKALQYKVMENRQNALGQQMNPHFISNALNAIQYYIHLFNIYIYTYYNYTKKFV